MAARKESHEVIKKRVNELMEQVKKNGDPKAREQIIEELKPVAMDYHHQDSVFDNSFLSRAYYIVHPQWVSENVNPPVSVPNVRKPWPWEQPSYRVNCHVNQLKIEHNDECSSKSSDSLESREPLPYAPPSLDYLSPRYSTKLDPSSLRFQQPASYWKRSF